jgi:hypothetical protein
MPEESSEIQRWVKRALLQGWLSIAFWMSVGLLLEGLLGYKAPAYLQDAQRRELFRLAHAHGTLLGLIVVIAGLVTQTVRLSPPKYGRLALQIGAAVMPFGFLISGIWHYESDPGLGIWLVPPAALLVIFGIIAMAFAAREGKSTAD